MTRYCLLLIIIFIASCKGKSSNNSSEEIQTKKSTDTFITTADTTQSAKNFFLSISSHDSSKASIIKNIQKDVSNIEQQHFKDTLSLENEEFMENMTDGGGELTGYFDSGKLVKMKLWIGLSYGVNEIDFYFSGDNLMYTSETANNFHLDSTGSFDYNHFDDHFERNSYFTNNKILYSVNTGSKRFEDENENVEKKLLNDAVYYKRIFLKHKKKK